MEANEEYFREERRALASPPTCWTLPEEPLEENISHLQEVFGAHVQGGSTLGDGAWCALDGEGQMVWTTLMWTAFSVCTLSLRRFGRSMRRLSAVPNGKFTVAAAFRQSPRRLCPWQREPEASDPAQHPRSSSRRSLGFCDERQAGVFRVPRRLRLRSLEDIRYSRLAIKMNHRHREAYFVVSLGWSSEVFAVLGFPLIKRPPQH